MSTVPPMPMAKTSGAAVASLVLGICSFFCFLITAIPGIVYGIVALRKIDAAKGALTGRGQAIAGLVMSGLSFFCLLPVLGIVTAIAVPALSQARDKAQEVQCSGQAAQIGHACLQYEIENGRPPRSLPDLEKHSPGISALKCPLAKDGETSYELAGPESTSAPNSNERVLLRETEPRHHGRRATVFADGHVEMRTDP